MSGYTATGPFVNGGAPALAQGFFNNIETWIQQTEGDTGAVSISGTTAGTATLYQFFQGSLKGFFLFFNGYRNSTATEQYLTLPVAITAYAIYLAGGGIPQTHIATGTTNINAKISDWNVLPTGSGAGGINAALNQMNGFDAGDITSAFDHIGLGVSQSQTYTAGLLVIGV
jgi:hypothetical protein